jgi:hypothetical protein
VKSSSAANDNLIDHTVALWQPRIGRDLSREDARQVLKDVTGFFTVLHEWSTAEAAEPDGANGARTEP